MAYKVFLSHCSADGDIAKWLAAWVNQAGVAVYIYEHDSQPGTELKAKLRGQIRAHDALVVLLSRKSQYAPMVHWEIGVAEDAGKLIVPLVQRGISSRCLTVLGGKERLTYDRAHLNAAKDKLVSHLAGLKKKKENQEGWGVALVCLGVLAFLGRN